MIPAFFLVRIRGTNEEALDSSRVRRVSTILTEFNGVCLAEAREIYI